MKKFHIIIILLLGIILMPNSAIACGNKNFKKSLDKEISCSKSDKKYCSCCIDSSISKENKECNGNCSDSLCGCTVTCTTPTVSFLPEINFETNIFNLQRLNKVNFSNHSPSIKDGFYSIWLIPKIS